MIPAAFSCVADEVQHAEHQHRDRLAEIETAGERLVREDRIRVADIPPDGDHAVPGGEQRVVVRHHDRVMVDVDDPRGGDGVPGDLVHARRGGQAAAQVEVLRDALLREEADRAEQERAVGQREPAGVEPGFHQLFGRGPVDGKVVLAVQHVVVDPGDARPGDVDPVGHARLVLPGRTRCRHKAPPFTATDCSQAYNIGTRGAAGPAARGQPGIWAAAGSRRVSGILARVSSSRGVYTMMRASGMSGRLSSLMARLSVPACGCR